MFQKPFVEADLVPTINWALDVAENPSAGAINNFARSRLPHFSGVLASEALGRFRT